MKDFSNFRKIENLLKELEDRNIIRDFIRSRENFNIKLSMDSDSSTITMYIKDINREYVIDFSSKEIILLFIDNEIERIKNTVLAKMEIISDSGSEKEISFNQLEAIIKSRKIEEGSILDVLKTMLPLRLKR